MQRFALRAAAFAAALFVCAGSAWTQPKLVRVNVVALDKSGQPVGDLAASDLQVLDDGKPQTIEFFRSNDNQHRPAAALASHEYSNRTEATPFGATIMVFDLLNGTFTDRNYIATSIVKALGRVEKPGNVFLYFITNHGEFYPIHPLPNGEADAAKLDQNWTTQSRAMIDAAIQNVYGLRPMDDRDTGVRAVTAYNLLHNLGAAASTLPGRKSVVWITDGMPLNIHYGGVCRDIKVMNVVAPCTGEFVDFTNVVRSVGAELDQDGVTVFPVEAYGVTVVTREVLTDLAQETGGKVVVSAGTPEALEDAVQAMRQNYTVAYQPANWDGKYHKLRVNCTRKGVQILAKQGYTAAAPTDETGQLMQIAALSRTDFAALGLRAAASDAGKPGTLRVQVHIDPTDLILTPDNGKFSGQLAMVFIGLTDKGPVTLTRPNALTLSMTQERYDKAVRDGIPLSDEVAVPANVRQLRVVVVDRNANRAGSVTLPASHS